MTVIDPEARNIVENVARIDRIPLVKQLLFLQLFLLVLLQALQLLSHNTSSLLYSLRLSYFLDSGGVTFTKYASASLQKREFHRVHRYNFLFEGEGAMIHDV